MNINKHFVHGQQRKRREKHISYTIIGISIIRIKHIFYYICNRKSINVRRVLGEYNNM